jgi:murein DD-endopeptidase MepM/ murein hydrolase activator NlpD
MASALRTNPSMARAMSREELANAARPSGQSAPTVWNNGRPVTPVVASATTPRLAQPTSTRWEDFSGLTNAPNNPDSPLNRSTAARSVVASAVQSSPNFYIEGSGRTAPSTRLVSTARNPEDARVLAAAMTPGGVAASRQSNYGQPLALPRTAPRQQGLIASAAGAPFRAVGGLFGRGGRSQGLTFPLADYNRLSSGFGYRRHPIGGNTRMHKGIDLSARPGTRIFAAAPGVVTWSGWKGGYGYCIIIDHKNGLSTLYGHCSKLVADVGDYVRAGEYIAEVGSTGASTGPHLHFEVHRNGVAVDPMPYLPMLN